jgi:hypothetical protein
MPWKGGNTGLRRAIRRRPKTSESRQVAGVFGWVREIPARA